MSLLVNEIFHSIQGEGPNVGKPAVFLRLSGCNLRCEWCDTKHTWHARADDEMLVDDILKKIDKFKCKHLVITGGEPLLQQKELMQLLGMLKNYYIEIETNGSIPCKINKYVEQINCSPKLNNSGNKPYQLKIKPSNKRVNYKFIVADKKDLREIKIYIRDNKIPTDKVYLMPEGTDKKIISNRSKWIIEICEKEGYNFTPRLHIMLDVR